VANAFTARGAAGFITETIGRVRDAGATGLLTLRADSGFYNHMVVAACRRLGVRFSITVRLSPALHRVIDGIADADWVPITYWLDGAADVAETTYTPFAHRGKRITVRLIVRRVKPTPGSQLEFAGFHYTHHALITDRDGAMLSLEADHRRHAVVENAIRDLKDGVALDHMPSGRFGANGAWLGFNVIAHNIARWLSRVALGETLVTTTTLRARHLAVPGWLVRHARQLHLHLPARWPWAEQFQTALEVCAHSPWPCPRSRNRAQRSDPDRVVARSRRARHRSTPALRKRVNHHRVRVANRACRSLDADLQSVSTPDRDQEVVRCFRAY
jgi:hypothetical protein